MTGKQREFIEQILRVAQDHIPNLHVSETSCCCGWQAPFTIASLPWPYQWAEHVFKMIEQKGLPCLDTKARSKGKSEAPTPASSPFGTKSENDPSSTPPIPSSSADTDRSEDSSSDGK